MSIHERSVDGRIAQLVRAPALQAGCRGFESLSAHHHFLENQLKRSKAAA
jgi:hypothetical protein